jgi:hypothetical protein
MNLDDLYKFMQEKRQEMYEEGNLKVEFTIAEFFELYQMVCYIKQIKHIMEDM